MLVSKLSKSKSSSSSLLSKANQLQCIMLLLLISCCLQFKDIFAGEKTITMVYKNNAQVVRQYYELLDAKQSTYDIELKSLNSVGKNNSPLFIAIGFDSFSGLLKKQLNVPIVAVFISRLSYRKAIKGLNNLTNVSAIFSDPNPYNQIKLAKLLYQKSINMAVLLSNETDFLRSEIARSAKQMQTKVRFVNVDDSNNIYKTLSKVYSYDVLLAIPDAKIYNSQSMRTILLTTYRHDQALMGFSKGMVKAGALATTTVDASDMAGETNRWLQRYLNTNKLPKPGYSKIFNIYVNEYVAESLNIYGDPEQIKKELVQR